MVPRDIAACAHPERQRVVAVRPRDQLAEPGIGKAGAGIDRDRSHDVAIAAVDQDVGDGDAQGLALRDGEQVVLALAGGGGHEVGLFEPRRGG